MDQVRQLLAAPTDEGGAALRKLGGVLLGVGALVLFFRRAGFEDPWGDFPLFVLLALPAVFLYGAGLIALRSTGTPSAWASVFVVFGLVFIPLALLQFVELIGGDSVAPLNIAWVFFLTAVAGAAAGLLADVRFGFLAASVALIIAWLALWDEILSDGIVDDFGTLRGMCMLIAAILVAAAFWVRTMDTARGLRWGSELITGAGLAVLLGAGLVSLAGAFASGVVDAFAPLGAVTSGNIPEPSFLWDLVLLVSSLLLVGFGSRFGARGPVYVGAIGLAVFTILVGNDLDDASPAGKVVGWPLALLLAGAAAFIASILPGRRYGSLGIDRLESASGGAPPEPPPPPPPPAPPPPASPPAPPPG